MIQFKNGEKDLNRRFSKEDIKMARKHENILSLVIRGIQIGTIMRHRATPTRKAVIFKERTNNRCEQGYRKLESSRITGRNIQWYSHCGNRLVSSLKH